MKNKKLIGVLLVYLGIILIIAHAIYKLFLANWVDIQHWGVLAAVIVLVIGLVMRGGKR